MLAKAPLGYQVYWLSLGGNCSAASHARKKERIGKKKYMPQRAVARDQFCELCLVNGGHWAACRDREDEVRKDGETGEPERVAWR